MVPDQFRLYKSIKDWNNVIDKIHFTPEDLMKPFEVIKKIKKYTSVIKLPLYNYMPFRCHLVSGAKP